MPVEEDNLHSIVSLIQMVGLLRGSSSTRESSLLSTKLYYWEEQSLECSKIQLDYLEKLSELYANFVQISTIRNSVRLFHIVLFNMGDGRHAFGPSCTEFVHPECWHFDNDATRKIDDVLTEHGGLLHVLPLAVHLLDK